MSDKPDLNGASAKEGHAEEIQVLLAYHQGAWNEITYRVTSRQSVQVAFLTSVITLGIGALSLPAFLRDSKNLSPQVERVDLFTLILAGLALGACLIAWIFYLWNRHNEGIIKILCDFNSLIEKKIHKLSGSGVQGWFEGDWLKKSLHWRRNSDKAMIIINAIALVPSVVGVVQADGQTKMEIVFFLVVLFLAAVPAVLMLQTHPLRSMPDGAPRVEP